MHLAKRMYRGMQLSTYNTRVNKVTVSSVTQSYDERAKAT